MCWWLRQTRLSKWSGIISWFTHWNQLFLDITISDAEKVARFMSCDLKDLFLAFSMYQPENTEININHLLPDIIQRYNIHEKVCRDGYFYIKINTRNIMFKTSCSLGIQKLSKNIYFMTRNMSTYTCQIISPKPLKVFPTLTPKSHAMYPTNRKCHHMDK